MSGETVADWLTLILTVGVGPLVVLTILRPWGDNWRDRPWAIGSCYLLGVLTWSGIAGFGVMQTWDSHTRILLMSAGIIGMVVWAAFNGRRRP